MDLAIVLKKCGFGAPDGNFNCIQFKTVTVKTHAMHFVSSLQVK